MIKKLIFSSFIFCFLTACTNIKPLSERLIVEVIGIDYDAQNGEYNLSIQLFTPQGGSSPTTIDPTQSNTKLVNATGESMYEALQNATLSIGNSFFYGDTRIIILGESASKNCFQEIMDFLSNFSETSANLMIVTTKGPASELLKLNITEGITPAVGITNLLKNSRLTGEGIELSYLEAMQGYLSKTLSPILPVVSLTQGKSSSETAVNGSSSEKNDSHSSSEISNTAPIKLDGTALFLNKKLIGYLNQNETKGLAIIRNKLDSTHYTAKIEKLKYANVSLYNLKSTIKVEQEGDQFSLKIIIKTQGDIKAFTFADNVNSLNDDDIRQLEKEIENQIKFDCEQTITKSMKEFNVDLFRIGDKVWKKDAKAYPKIRDNYADFIKNLDVTLDIHVNINRIGLENILK